MTKQEFMEFIENNVFDMVELDFDNIVLQSNFKNFQNLEQKLNKWLELDRKIKNEFEEKEVCLTDVGIGKEDLYFKYTNALNLPFDNKDKPLIEIKLWV